MAGILRATATLDDLRPGSATPASGAHPK
jgi:hypothetical protein